MQLKIADFQDCYAGKQLPCEHKHVLLACMPKSGSTYLAALIENLPGFQAANLVGTYEGREQELVSEQLIGFHRTHYVAQHHVRHHSATQKFMFQFSLKPIVMVRNLHDIVYSTYDHMKRESIVGAAAFVPGDMMDRPKEDVLSFIVDMIIPWYFNFYCSWQQCHEKLVLRYEDWTGDPLGTLRRITHYIGFEASEGDLRHAVEMASGGNTRFNKGVAGRGRDLPRHLKDRIAGYAAYYRDQDFSDILDSNEPSFVSDLLAAENFA